MIGSVCSCEDDTRDEYRNFALENRW